MFDEILKSIKGYWYDRTTSPLMGSFLVSWVIWNYRFVFLLFSDMSIEEKFKTIDEVIFPNWESVLINGAIYPILISLIYIYIYPFPAKKVFEFSRTRQKEISDIKRKIEDETLLTVKESRTIRGEIYTLEESFQDELNRKDREIERLKNELAAASNDGTATSLTAEEILAQPNEIDSDQIKLLSIIGNFHDEAPESSLISSIDGGYVKAQYLLGELEGQEYIKKDYDQADDEYTYALTHKGKAFLVKSGNV